MPVTDVNSVAEQVQKFWAPQFMKELRESHMLASICERSDYEGVIKQKGDTVYVSQVHAPEGQMLDVGTDADTFESEQLVTSRIAIVANKRAVAAFEISDLAELQSQLGNEKSAIRESLMFSVARQVNDFLYSKVAPSASAPDHILNGITDFNAAHIATLRKLAAQARWLDEKGWWILADPSYYSDILNATTLSSSDYVGSENQVVVGGKVVNKRFGFNILEDNSRGLVNKLATSGEDAALAFHPDFLPFVMQTEPTFKVSDLHSQKKFGYLVSVDLVCGASLGIDGAKKHIRSYAT